MVINAVIERFGANPAHVSSATTMDVVAPVYLLDEDTAIGALLDVRVSLGPPIQQQFLPALRPDQHVLLASQSTVGRLVTVGTRFDQTSRTLDNR